MVYILYFLYPFIGCWAPQLILQFGYCEQSCNRREYPDVSCILIYTPSDMCPLMIWQGHEVGLVLVFRGPSILISIMVALVSDSSFFPSVLTSNFHLFLKRGGISVSF
jgi:hypothetical protein